jgi:hypothetical protein
MIFYDLIPEDKFSVGTLCKIHGKVKESGQVATVSFIRDYHRYQVVDDTNVSWTKNGMLYECFEDNHFLKDILCGYAPRIIPI